MSEGEHEQPGRGVRPPLRVGLLLDDTKLIRMFAAVVDTIRASHFARLEFLVLRDEEPAGTQAPRSRLMRIATLLRDSRRRSQLLFDYYQRWDGKRVEPELDPLVEVDCTAQFAGVDRIRVKPITKGFVHRFPPEAIEAIRRKDLDVILRFGFNIIRGEVLQAARYGIWSYHHGDNDFYRGGPAHFWELVEKNPTSGVILQVLNEKLDAGLVLMKGSYATEGGLSLTANRVRPYWASVSFVIEKLRELYEHGWEHVEQRVVPPAPYRGKRQLYRTPTNSEVVRWLAPEIVKKAVRYPFRHERVAHWRLATRTGPKSLVDSTALDGFRWIASPGGHYYADPFAVADGDATWLFFEDYRYDESRAVIACAELRGDGTLGEPATVLDDGRHLSYPCVFAHGGDWFMVPESRARGAVLLYRAVRFPHEWKLEKTLYSGNVVDTSVHVTDEVVWFFVPIVEPRGGGTHLWLFSADGPDGEWRAHPDSPISTDVRRARGGGAIFRSGERLFRPAQDCSRVYGYGFSLNEVVQLTPERYEERTVRVVEPGPQAAWTREISGTHTYARAGDIEIVDAFVWSDR